MFQVFSEENGYLGVLTTKHRQQIVLFTGDDKLHLGGLLYWSCPLSNLIYKFTTSVCLSVCDGHFGGWGKGQGGEAAGDPFHSLDQST